MARNDRRGQLSARLEAIAASAILEYGDDRPVVPASSLFRATREGYTARVRRGTHSVTIWNAKAHLGHRVVASRLNLAVILQMITEAEGSKHLLRCSVEDQHGYPKRGVPVDLGQWQLNNEDLFFVEQHTDQQGQTKFEVKEEHLPWTSISVGTVDGVRSVKEFCEEASSD